MVNLVLILMINTRRIRLYDGRNTFNVKKQSFV